MNVTSRVFIALFLVSKINAYPTRQFRQAALLNSSMFARFTEFAKTASSRLYQNNKIAIVTDKLLRVKINRTKFCVLLRKVNEVQQRNHRHETLKFHNILPLQKFRR